jgi:hypothetical protein
MTRYQRIKPKPIGEPKFYDFSQNNTGGKHHIDDENGIGPRVWIEAHSSTEANQLAEELGIYFEGVMNGNDCRCCGDRWYPVTEYDGSDVIEPSPEYDFNWHDTVYVHKLDGTLERIKGKKKW